MLAQTLLLMVAGLQAPNPDRWDGFEPGSWVETVTRRFGSPDDTPGRRQREELVRRDADRTAVVSLSRWRSDEHAFTESESRTPRPLLTTGTRELSQRTEARTINGKTLNCRVVTYASTDPQIKEPGTFTIWHAEGVRIPAREMSAFGRWGQVPADTVFARFEGPRGHSTLEVLDLEAKIRIRDRDLPCVLQTVVSLHRNGDAGALRSKRLWISDAVPGRLARMDFLCTGRLDTRPEDYHSREEVTDFSVAPPK